MFCFFENLLDPETFNYQILIAYHQYQSTRREWSAAASSSSIFLIAFEEMNEDGSDIVFHAENTVSKSLHDDYTIPGTHTRDTVGRRASDLDITVLCM